MLIIAGSLYVDPGRRDDYLAAVAGVAPLARRSEGCLDFVQAADPHDAGRVVVFERWDSDEALAAFRDLPADAVATDGPPPPEVLSADVRRYRVSAVEDA